MTQDEGLVWDEVEAFINRLDDSREEFDKSDAVIVQLEMERELLGIPMTEHPLRLIQPVLRRKLRALLTKDLRATRPGQVVRVAGLVKAVKTHYTKAGQPMAWVTLEDMSGEATVTVFPQALAENASHLVLGNLIVVDGKASHQAETRKKKQEVDHSEDGEEDSVVVAESDEETTTSIRYELICDGIQPVGVIYG